jgi:hypothetical protein
MTITATATATILLDAVVAPPHPPLLFSRLMAPNKFYLLYLLSQQQTHACKGEQKIEEAEKESKKKEK